MTKPLTYLKPSGEWGIEGVDLATLPPPGVWGAGQAYAAGAPPLRHPGGNAPAGQRGGDGRYVDTGLP